MVKESPHVVLVIDGHILVNGTLGQTLVQEVRGGHGSCGHQNVQARACLQKSIDQWEDRQGLTNTRPMDPDQGTSGSGDVADAPPLIETQTVFFAAR